jgi:hypothetical protein
MNVTLPIPDELAARLGEAGDLSRRALEAFAADEYRAGRLSHVRNLAVVFEIARHRTASKPLR